MRKSGPSTAQFSQGSRPPTASAVAIVSGAAVGAAAAVPVPAATEKR